MDLISKTVEHKFYNKGIIVKITNNYVVISFEDELKTFLFPDAFEKYLKFSDNSLNEYVADLIAEKKAKAKADDAHPKTAAPQTIVSTKKGTNRKKSNRVSKPNVFFKCTYCDGGQSSDCVGFKGYCSDSVRLYNIENAKHVWCSADDCICFQNYRFGTVWPRFGDSFCCYESRMLLDWKAMAGVYRHGEREGQPMKLKNVQSNSLAVLTTRYPDNPEEGRIFFAVFLVDSTYEGDENIEGYVTTKSKFKLELTPSQAKRMLFWKYHFNDNQPKKCFWGSGLHRYFDDYTAAQILRDIVSLKENCEDYGLAEEFYNYFCETKKIKKENIPTPQGALTR